MMPPAPDPTAYLALCPDPCAVLDEEGRALQCNPRWTEFLGAGNGITLSDALQPEDTEGLLRVMGDALRLADSGRVYALRFETRCAVGSTSRSWLQVHILGDVQPTHRRLLVQVRDLTVAREAEQQRMDINRSFERMLDQTPLPVWLADADGERSWSNQAWLGFTGRVQDEEQGCGWLERVHPQDLAATVDRFASGFRSGRKFSVECRMLNHNSEAQRMMQFCHPRLNTHGELVGYIGICVETEALHRAEQERERVMQRVLINQKLESLGVLAGGVAHDFGNLLMSVLGNADVALMELEDPSKVKERLEDIREAATQAGSLCKQLLAYSGRTQPMTERRDINGIVTEFEHLLRTLVRDQATLEFDLHADIAKAECDPTQIRQVVMNLVRNAVDAAAKRDQSQPTPGDPLHITVSTGEVDIDESQLHSAIRHDRTRPGRFVFLEIADNGPGIQREVVERMFEPFWSGEGGDGHGLGLAAVRGIILAHKGAVLIDTAPGRGAAFKVCLPAVRQPYERVLRPRIRKLATRPVIHSNTARALLVDDNADVRRVGSAMLGLCGFVAETVPSGEAALDILEQAESPYTLVVLDLSMPGLSGTETLARIRKLRPEQPVLIASGHMNNRSINGPFDIEGIAKDEFTNYLAKPFRLSALQKSLAELLGPSMPETHLHGHLQNHFEGMGNSSVAEQVKGTTDGP